MQFFAEIGGIAGGYPVQGVGGVDRQRVPGVRVGVGGARFAGDFDVVYAPAGVGVFDGEHVETHELYPLPFPAVLEGDRALHVDAVCHISGNIAKRRGYVSPPPGPGPGSRERYK